MLKIFEKASLNTEKVAVIANNSSYSYGTLLSNSQQLATELLVEKLDLKEARVAYMLSPGFEYIVSQWAIWQAGGIAVPLCISYPLPSLQYVLENTGAEIIIVGQEFKAFITPLLNQLNTIKLIVYSDEIFQKNQSISLPIIDVKRRAMILFTSGTTNLPKGVVTTHANIDAQISTLILAWQWTNNDHILCVLPLHHVHGIINVVSCALYIGAKVEFIPKYSEQAVFEVFAKAEVNLFMAVPTIYFKLIAYWESLEAEQQNEITETLSKFRLMVSGSAALPISVMEKWKNISQHVLLERYGMTEIGMGISNPYFEERKAGYIGMPLPGVEIRLADEFNKTINTTEAGEIQVKGKSVFLEYWNKPEATKAAFTNDGWFKTGDIAIVENGYYKILGRESIDIIKSGGYKISALEIEEIIRTFPKIVDCSVVGIPDEEWGELVVAAIIVVNNEDIISELIVYTNGKLPKYKCPKIYKIVSELPRNAMGKVVKNELKSLFINL